MRERLQTPVSTEEARLVRQHAKAFNLSVAEYVRMRLGLAIKRKRGRPPVQQEESAGR